MRKPGLLLVIIALISAGLKQKIGNRSSRRKINFSNDGKYLAFSSNRNNRGTRDTNLFIAEWLE